MVILVYRIRHTEDETFLRQECIYLVSVWVTFSIIQYLITIFNYDMQCRERN